MHASAARYPMDNRDVIDIGLCIIKCCRMYAKEYKNWISCNNAVPLIVKMIDSLKEYWANAIALVNQTAILASQHGYGMTAMDDDALVAAYNDSLMKFGAAFAAMQETIKNQANSLVAMQTQLANIQLCMNVGQQPSSSGYAPAQQQCMFTNHNKCNDGGQGNGRGFPQQPTMSYSGTGGGQQHNMHPPPNITNFGRIGTTVPPMEAMLMTITSVQHVANQVPCTTPMKLAPTSWADQSPECTSPSCHRLPDALHPVVAPSNSSAFSNVHLKSTTPL
jgi:hypothetical protein